jgi:carbamate kinase
MSGRVVVALGGNALVRPGEEGTAEQQTARLREVCPALVPLCAGGLVITHGNGPQVGAHLLRNELGRDEVPPMPLDLAVAATQGEIGWLVQQALGNALRAAGQDVEVVAVGTQVVVDGSDPAFGDPTKFVGAFVDEATARERQARLGWRMRRDADRGWRRVVPSPRPSRVLEVVVVRDLLSRGHVVVAGGGGGVPVLETPGGQLAGVEAVVDKDEVASLLGTAVGADRLVVLTGVEHVFADFGTPRERPLDRLTVSEAKALLAAAQFPSGSMGPKILAAIGFLERGGREVHITTPEAFASGTGTTIVPDAAPQSNM